MKKILVLTSVLFTIFVFSQERQESEKIIQEIQQVKQSNSSMKLVWWIPTEYWQIAMQKQDNITQAQVDYIKDAFDPYTIIVAGDFSLEQSFTGLEFKVNNIKNSFALLDEKSAKVPPLKESEIDEMVVRMINDILKPLFGQMLGKTGTGVEVFIYKNRNSTGQKLLDPTKKGELRTKVGADLFKWTLPLVSLMEEKTCSIDQIKFPGNYLYCPFHGNKL
ncbi:hypothetical protein [Chryseobacterium sp. MP_3.2]|uniref:hypothetical protein n=1 Tax=Chryseobacterium sp. MP_3.2 TaxID=3071712 RepID=UPI002DFCF456|nr:hypothetical protein [Chryseobacterium sp. MP_3.2]